MTRPAGPGGGAATLARVIAAERGLALLGVQPAPTRHFRRSGPWLVEERFAAALLRGRLTGGAGPAPAQLAAVGAGRLLRALLASPRLPAACRARAVFSKDHPRAKQRNHLRAFYFEPRPLVLKGVPPERRADLARELSARSQAPAELGAPAVVAHDLDGPQPFLFEEFLVGRHPDPGAADDVDRVLAFAAGPLWRSYRDAGFDWRRCGDSHDVPALVENFDSLAAAVPWRSSWPERAALRGALLALADRRDRLLPWCRAHGDLSLPNLLVADGRVRLLDWERARPLPIAHELAKLAIAVPGLWPALREPLLRAAAESSPGAMLEPDSQAVLGTLERLKDLGLRFSRRAASTGESKREAARLARRLAPAVDHLVRMLAGGRG